MCSFLDAVWVFSGIVAIYWGVPAVVSAVYILFVWLIQKDIVFEAVVWWRGWIPALRFRLRSRKTWYTKFWTWISGSAVFGVMIHKDEDRPGDDKLVEKTIAHEMRHVNQMYVFGILQPLVYLGHMAVLWFTPGKHPYFDNVWEVDAREAADRWVQQGRPKWPGMGPRR